MSLKEGKVPLIAITQDDNMNAEDIEDDNERTRDILDTHTDVEDLEMDFDDMSISKSRKKLLVKLPAGDIGSLTDVEDIEASEDEDEEPQVDFSSPQAVAALEGMLDVEGTYEELFKYDSVSNSGKTTVSTGQPTFHGLGFPENSKVSGVATDVEDFSASDDETIVKSIIQEVDSEVLGEMLENLGTVDIADRVKRFSHQPSPIHTPMRGFSPVSGNISPDYTDSTFLGEAVGFSSSHRLSSIPSDNLRRLSAVTDTEMLDSDSDDEKPVIPKMRHYSSKERSNLQPPCFSKGSTTDVEDVEFSDDENVPSRRKVDTYDTMVAQTESSKECVKTSYRSKKSSKKTEGKLLALPKEREDALTDVEDLEASGTEDESADEKNSYLNEQSDKPIFSIVEMESMYGSVMESQTTLDTSHGQEVSIENPLTDTEDLATSSPMRFSRGKHVDDQSSVSSECSTEEGSVQDSDTDTQAARRSWREGRMQLPVTEVKFVDRHDGKDPVPVVVSPNASKKTKTVLSKPIKSSLLQPKPVDGGTTDVEELLSSDDSDVEVSKGISQKEEMGGAHATDLNTEEGGTDLEDFEADNLEDIDFSPKLPPPMNTEDIPGFPPPVRELTLVKQNNEGHPTVLVLPLDEVRARGLFIPEESGAAPTDVEDITDSEDEGEDPELGLRVIDADGNTTVLVTPDLPQIEGGIIESTESIKVERKKLKLPSQAMADPTTDTEEMFLDTSPAQRRRKVRPRPQSSSTKKSPSASTPFEVAATVTDIEELEVSDLDSVPPGVKVSKDLSGSAGEAESTPYTSDAKTDLEDMEASDVDEHFEMIQNRDMSATPELLHEYELETISEKQGDGPFTEDVRQRVLIQHTQMRSYDSKNYSRKLGSLGSAPAIRMTSPSPDIPTTTDTEDIFGSADEGRESPTPPPVEISLEFAEHSSVVHVRHTRKIDVDAPNEAIYVKGHQNLDVHTDVEDLGLSEEEGQQHEDERNDVDTSKNSKDFNQLSEDVLAQVSVYDDTNKVCVCMGSKDQDSVENASKVCVCIGMPDGDITIAPESSMNSEIISGAATSAGLQQQENSEGLAAMGPTEEWTERMQQKQTSGHEIVAPEDAGETEGVEHLIQEDATATFSTTMRGSEFYQMQDPEATSEYVPSQPTTQSRVVTTRTHTRTVMGEDGRPVTVTTTETEVGDASGAEGMLDNNQLRESMQQIIDQFAAGEESKEGRGKKEEKPE